MIRPIISGETTTEDVIPTTFLQRECNEGCVSCVTVTAVETFQETAGCGSADISFCLCLFLDQGPSISVSKHSDFAANVFLKEK